MLGLVFGSGFENFELVDCRTQRVSTPFGETEYDLGVFAGQEIVVLHRHGKDQKQGQDGHPCTFEGPEVVPDGRFFQNEAVFLLFHFANTS